MTRVATRVWLRRRVFAAARVLTAFCVDVSMFIASVAGSAYLRHCGRLSTNESALAILTFEMADVSGGAAQRGWSAPGNKRGGWIPVSTCHSNFTDNNRHRTPAYVANERPSPPPATAPYRPVLYFLK